MNDQFGSIGDMITLVASNQQAEATPVLHDLLGARILDALQGHKQEIAQTLFAPGTEALAEESEQLDEISAATAYSAGKKRLVQGQGLTNAALDADKDPKHSAYTHKQYAKQADTAFDKAKKNYEYALKKDKIGFHEESEQLDEYDTSTDHGMFQYHQDRAKELGPNHKEYSFHRKKALHFANKAGVLYKSTNEESEQLDEISAATAVNVGQKRHNKGLHFDTASSEAKDPLTKKVFANKAHTNYEKSTKAFNYAYHKRDKDARLK